MNYGEESVSTRKLSGGQIFTGLKKKLKTKEDLSIYYTPGIAEPCRLIAQDKTLTKTLTIKKNSVAVISDGSAVLGLGNIGPEAGLPVMEGKSMLFKNFADIDAYPIVLATQDTEEIIQTVKNIAPTFGGINLEDISAPRCFEIEKRLSAMLDIPVFHDDQDGTAMVVLAGLKNALRVVGKKKEDIKIVFSGSGAAGIAVARLLKHWGVQHIKMVDSKGLISCKRLGLTFPKKEFCSTQTGDLALAIKGADVFIGVSKPNIVTQSMIESMNSDAIVFAMANPNPEILPELAKKGGARIVATGRSDFPNQVNNVLIFPGFFRGLLDSGISNITTEMKIAAAETLASCISNPTEEEIIPYALDFNIVPKIAATVKNFAKHK
ncbi:NADP-dependent malic enzyme [Candidatus Gracilibacteria bacterium]|nr:NADP-dependent malic enzyme [Candidatus Gracilibacteria bacterium]